MWRRKMMLIQKVQMKSNQVLLFTDCGNFFVSKRFAEENHAVPGTFLIVSEDGYMGIELC